MPWREEVHHGAQLGILSVASVAADVQRQASVVIRATRRELAAIVIKRALVAVIVVRASEYIGCAAINFTRHRSMRAVDRMEWAASSLVATSVAAAGVLGVRRAGGRPLLGVGFFVMPAFYAALATRETLVITRSTKLQHYEATIFAATSAAPIFALLPPSLRYLVLPPLVCPPFCAAILSERAMPATDVEALAVAMQTTSAEDGHIGHTSKASVGVAAGVQAATAELVAKKRWRWLQKRSCLCACRTTQLRITQATLVTRLARTQRRERNMLHGQLRAPKVHNHLLPLPSPPTCTQLCCSTQRYHISSNWVRRGALATTGHRPQTWRRLHVSHRIPILLLLRSIITERHYQAPTHSRHCQYRRQSSTP